MCLADFAGQVAELDVAGFDDPGTNAAEVKLFATAGVDKHQGVDAEAGREFFAPCMWGFRDLDDRIAQRDLRSRWQVFAAQIEIYK